jgi:hypothetical protein
MITLQQEYELENEALAIDPELIGGTVRTDYKDWLEQKITNLRVREYTIQKQSVGWMTRFYEFKNNIKRTMGTARDYESQIDIIMALVKEEERFDEENYGGAKQEVNPPQPPLTESKHNKNNEYKTKS